MKEVWVPKGTYTVLKDDEVVLVARNLGSALGLCVRDTSNGVFGLCVMVVPSLKEPLGDMASFDATRGLKDFFHALTEQGAQKKGLSCWMVGVAQFLECPKDINIGLQLYSLVKRALDKNGVKVEKEFVGGPYNRTVRFGLGIGPDIWGPGIKKES